MDMFQEDFNSAILQACKIHGVDYLKDIQAKETFTPTHYTHMYPYLTQPFIFWKYTAGFQSLNGS